MANQDLFTTMICHNPWDVILDEQATRLFLQMRWKQRVQQYQSRIDSVVLFVIHCDLFQALNETDIESKDIFKSVIQFCNNPLYDFHLVRQILTFVTNRELHPLQ